MTAARGAGPLDADRCRQLLGAGGVGRVVFSQAALPAVVTMNYTVHAGRLHFRTAADTALARSVADAVVAFNVDRDEGSGVPPDGPGGGAWSVTVTGRCRKLEDPPPAVRDALQAWAPGVREEFFALDLALLTGHRIEVPVSARPAGPA